MRPPFDCCMCYKCNTSLSKAAAPLGFAIPVDVRPSANTGSARGECSEHTLKRWESGCKKVEKIEKRTPETRTCPTTVQTFGASCSTTTSNALLKLKSHIN